MFGVVGRIGREGERWEGDIRVIGVVGAIVVVGLMGWFDGAIQYSEMINALKAVGLPTG